MGIYLNPGNESFQRALRSRIYIDKTELIQTRIVFAITYAATSYKCKTK